MPVKNCLKSVLEQKLNIERLTAYRFGKLTGFGRATSDKINDPGWIPGPESLQTICEKFNLQPGEFLYWIPPNTDSEVSAGSWLDL